MSRSARKAPLTRSSYRASCSTCSAQQPCIVGNPYVFASVGTGPFNSFADGVDTLREMLPDLPRWTLHDLRRTSRKLMTRAGVRPDVAELALGHSIKGIQAVYDPVDEYQPFIDHGSNAWRPRSRRSSNLGRRTSSRCVGYNNPPGLFRLHALQHVVDRCEDPLGREHRGLSPACLRAAGVRQWRRRDHDRSRTLRPNSPSSRLAFQTSRNSFSSRIGSRQS